MSRDLSEDDTLGTARDWLRERVEEGQTCPCCGQLAKVYRRKIHTTIARSLIDVHRLAQPENDYYVHVPTAISPACEVGKARYWGLVEEAQTPRPDGGRAGWWRLTEHGKDFVTGRVSVHAYARIYNGRCLNLLGELISIRQALGDKFDYQALMAR